MHCLDACLKQQSMPTPLAVFELPALLILSRIAYLSIFFFFRIYYYFEKILPKWKPPITYAMKTYMFCNFCLMNQNFCSLHPQRETVYFNENNQ